VGQVEGFSFIHSGAINSASGIQIPSQIGKVNGRCVQENSTPVLNNSKVLHNQQSRKTLIENHGPVRRPTSGSSSIASTSLGRSRITVDTSCKMDSISGEAPTLAALQNQFVETPETLHSSFFLMKEQNSSVVQAGGEEIAAVNKKQFMAVIDEVKEITNKFTGKVKTLFNQLTSKATKNEINIPTPKNKMQFAIVDTFSKLIENETIKVSTKAMQKFNAASDDEKINIATQEVYNILSEKLEKEGDKDILDRLLLMQQSKKPPILKALKTIELYNRYDLGNGEKLTEPYPKKDFNIDQELEKLKEQGFSNDDIEILENRAQNVKSGKGINSEDRSLRVFFGIKLDLASKKQNKFNIDINKSMGFNAEQLDDLCDLMQRNTTTQADIDKFFKDVELFNQSPY